MDNNFTAFLSEQIAHYRETMLKDVMKMVLGREPTIEDTAEFEILHQEITNREFISHKVFGLLGELIFSSRVTPTGVTFNYTYVPKRFGNALKQ